VALPGGERYRGGLNDIARSWLVEYSGVDPQGRVDIRGFSYCVFLENSTMIEGFAVSNRGIRAVDVARGTQPDLLHCIRKRPIPYNFEIIIYSYFGGRLDAGIGAA